MTMTWFDEDSKTPSNAPERASRPVSNTGTANKTTFSDKPRKPRTGAAPSSGSGAERGPRRFERKPAEYEEKLVHVARVTTVVKGGRRFSFSATVVIGNRKGKVGYGHGKANEVPDAIKKAVKDAQRNLIDVPIIDQRTIPHEAQAKYVATRVLIKPAPIGKGIIASGSVRAVVELAGYRDIVTKAIGSSNRANNVKATIKALQMLTTAEKLSKLRDVSIN